MNWPSVIKWSIAALPAALGILFNLVIGASNNNLTFDVSISLNYILLFSGLLLSVPLLAGLVLWEQQLKTRKKALARVKSEADTDRIRFLKRLHHELKNPLTAIHLNASYLKPEGTEQISTLASLQKQVERLITLTRDIRKVVEIDTFDLDTRRIDLPQLLKELMDLIEDHPEATDREIDLIVPQAPWPLPKISGDWDLILLAIYNLVENAIKFSQPGDGIEIRAREESKQVVIEIADTGPGINKEDLEYVWEELYRGSTTKSVTGSGLGLSLVKAIAERHSGTVSLDSRFGRGTVFSIALPV